MCNIYQDDTHHLHHLQHVHLEVLRNLGLFVLHQSGMFLVGFCMTQGNFHLFC